MTRLLIVGPTPPPHHGVSLAIKALLDSQIIHDAFEIIHVDIADRRGIEYVDKPDLHDVMLFLRQWLSIISAVLFKRPRLFYLPISQQSIGFLRDSFFILPAWLGGCRILLHLHGGNLKEWNDSRNPLFRRYIRFVLKKAAAGIVLGESLRDSFANFLPSPRIWVVPNGVPSPNGVSRQMFFRKDRRKYGILYLGTLARQKGVQVFVKAIPLVLEKVRNVRFVLAGPWSKVQDEKTMTDYIRDYELHEFVEFTGMVEGAKKSAVLMHSDIFVFPGIQQEGQPLVVLEAMAHGLPILFTNRGCLRETVAEGETGLEIEIDNPKDLADKILFLLRNPPEMLKMGEAGQRRHGQLFTTEAYAARMLNVLRQAAELENPI